MGYIPEMQDWLKIWKSINEIYHINKKKLYISIDKQKAFDKIQPLSMTKYLNLTKDV